MKRTFAKNMEGAKGKNELTEDAILNAIPVDARDGLIDINEPDGSFGRYTWYVKFAPFSDEEAKEAANGIKRATGRRTQVAGFGREIYVLIMDYSSRPTSESRKLVKEGAGAGYTVEIKGLKFGKILSKKIVPDEYYGYYECQVEILPGEYEIAANDYYNDYFWEEHEFGITPEAQIDGGVATVVYSKQWKDDEQAEDDLVKNVENMELDISFDYGAGWMHADLPREKIEVDRVDIDERDVYFGIDKLVLNAPDLAAAVNSGFQSTFDMDEEDEEDEEPVDESTEAAKINLTWDEFNKLCDLIDMDWKRWNKNSAKSIPLVADRAVEHLEWIANKRLKGLDPKDVTISYTIPGSGIDEYDTGTQNTQTIYELIEGMAWDNYNPYNESDYGGAEEFFIRIRGKTCETFNDLEDAREYAMEGVVGNDAEIEIVSSRYGVLYRYWENLDTCADYEEDVKGGSITCLNANDDAGLSGFEDWPMEDDFYQES